jgi:hypothetical protein
MLETDLLLIVLIDLHCGMKGQLLYVDSERFDIISSFTRPHKLVRKISK